MTTLQNKTALVTGASRGIGRATALALAEAGAHVLVHYGRSERGSSIVVISSLGARLVVGKSGPENPSILAYASTKGALETLVKNWAATLGLNGIRVNAVAPGVIDTDMSNFTKTEAGREVTLGMQALKRIGKPEELPTSSLLWRPMRRAGSRVPAFPSMAARSFNWQREERNE